MKKGDGWRKVLRAAITGNPLGKGEGMSPGARRERLGQNPLAEEL